MLLNGCYSLKMHKASTHVFRALIRKKRSLSGPSSGINPNSNQPDMLEECEIPAFLIDACSIALMLVRAASWLDSSDFSLR